MEQVITLPALLTVAKLTPYAVLDYCSALAIYGMSRNVQTSHTVLSQQRMKPCKNNDVRFQPCLPPKSLKDSNTLLEKHWMLDIPVPVVARERLLVNLLDRMELSEGWEEIINAFRYESDLDWKKMLNYVKQLNHPATAARLGFLLELYQKTMKVPERMLSALESLIPGTSEHFYRSKRKGSLVKRWNLYVPDEIIESAKGDDCEF